MTQPSNRGRGARSGWIRRRGQNPAVQTAADRQGYGPMRQGAAPDATVSDEHASA